ncbi:MAG: hypothetical protein ACRCZE_02730 [Candidatus Altimarinota bacterium]
MKANKLGNSQSGRDDAPATKRSALSLRRPPSKEVEGLKNGDYPEQLNAEKAYDQAFFEPEVRKQTEQVKKGVERALKYSSTMDDSFAESFDDEKTINESLPDILPVERILAAPVSKRPTLRPVGEKQGVDDAVESLDNIRLELAKTNHGKYAAHNRLITNLQIFRDKDGKYEENSSVQEIDNKNYRVGLINFSGGFLSQRKKLGDAETAEMSVEMGEKRIEFNYAGAAEGSTEEVYENTEAVLEDLIKKADKVDSGYITRAAARLENVDNRAITVGKGVIDLENKLLETTALGNRAYKVVLIRKVQLNGVEQTRILDATRISNDRSSSSNSRNSFNIDNGTLHLEKHDVILALPKSVLNAIVTPYDKDENVSKMDLGVEQLDILVEMMEESKDKAGLLDANALKAKLQEVGMLKEGALKPNGSFSIMAIELK